MFYKAIDWTDVAKAGLEIQKQHESSWNGEVYMLDQDELVAKMSKKTGIPTCFLNAMQCDWTWCNSWAIEQISKK